MKRLAVLVLVAACSGHSAATAKPDPVAGYVAQVNALCDDLLPKVIASMGGGHTGTYPVAVFRKEWPAHRQLLVDFDKAVAQIPVPGAAASEAHAFQAYVHYANLLDGARLAAAAKGQKAFDAQIKLEPFEQTSPVITTRDEAGFSQSCNAR